MNNSPDYAYIAKLVMACWNDDSNAFAELYALTCNKVYNYCHHYLRDPYLAQDAVQEIYISALQNIHKLNDPTLFIAWLNQICFHICYDISSKKNNDQYESLDNDVFDFLQDDHDDMRPDTAMFQKADSEILKGAIDSLPFNEQQIIIMHYFNNMKLQNIADAMSISLSSVKRYLSSAQGHLRQLLIA